MSRTLSQRWRRPGRRRMPRVAQAAYTALVALFPGQKALFDTKLAVSMAAFAARESTGSIASGAAWGLTVANQILDVEGNGRFFDGAPPFFGNPIVGVWRATPPGLLPFAGVQFTNMTPWVIEFPNEVPARTPACVDEPSVHSGFQRGEKHSVDRTARFARPTRRSIRGSGTRARHPRSGTTSP